MEFGGSTVWLSPRGEYFSAPDELQDKVPSNLLASLNKDRFKAGSPCFDIAFTVAVDSPNLHGVVLTFADQEDNRVLQGFTTTVKVRAGRW